jgi:hypothetical protein
LHLKRALNLLKNAPIIFCIRIEFAVNQFIGIDIAHYSCQ